MLLGALGASLLTGRGLSRAEKGMYESGNQGQGLFRAGQGVKKKSLTSFHPLTNFEIQYYFKDEPRFNGVYSRNNLPNFKNGAYVINLDYSGNTRTHWVVIFVKKDEVIYFDSFDVEYIPKEIMERKKKKTLTRVSLEYNTIIQ